DVLVEIDAERRGTGQHVVAVDPAGEGLVLHLFSDGSGVDLVHTSRGGHERRGGDQPGKLVDGEQRLGERRDAWNPGVIAVAEDGLEDVVGPTAVAEDPDS